MAMEDIAKNAVMKGVQSVTSEVQKIEEKEKQTAKELEHTAGSVVKHKAGKEIKNQAMKIEPVKNVVDKINSHNPAKMATDKAKEVATKAAGKAAKVAAKTKAKAMKTASHAKEKAVNATLDASGKALAPVTLGASEAAAQVAKQANHVVGEVERKTIDAAEKAEEKAIDAGTKTANNIGKGAGGVIKSSMAKAAGMEGIARISDLTGHLQKAQEASKGDVGAAAVQKVASKAMDMALSRT